MIITISGSPGSGKSTVADYVAKKLGMKRYSMGDFQREIARDKNESLAGIAEKSEQDDSIDNRIDQRQKKLGETEDNFIVDSRIGFYFIPHSIKIFLDVDTEVGAKRIYEQKREDEKFSTIEKTKDEMKRRVDSEKKRYKEYYNVDHYDMKNYDIVIDTTEMNVAEAGEEVIKQVKEHHKI